MRVVFLIALVAGIFLLFANSLSYPFINYDDWWLVHHPRLSQWISVSGIQETFFDFSYEVRMQHGAEYLPIRDLSAAIQFKLFGENPLPYRLVQVLLYGISSVFLFLFFGKVGVPKELCIWAIAFFAVHPIHVEPVVWLSSHKDILSLFFVSLFLLAYAYERLWLALVFLGLAMGSKYPVLIMPVVLPFVDRCLGRFIGFRRYIPFFLLSIACFSWASYVGDHVQYGHANVGDGFFSIILNTLVFVDGSIRHLLTPLDLQLYYPFHKAISFLDVRVLRGALELFLAGLILWYYRYRSIGVVFGIVVFLFGLLPMIRAPQIHLLADRYLLISSIGFCLLLATAFMKISIPILRRSLAFILVGVFAFLTIAQQQVWSSSLRLWEYTAQGRSPVHPYVWKNLAKMLQKKNQWSEARTIYRKALAGMPENDLEYLNLLTELGFVELQIGNLVSAEQMLHKALKKDPNHAKAYVNLGIIYIRQGKPQRARKYFRKAAHANPYDSTAYFNLARLDFERGDFASVRKWLRFLEYLAPKDPKTEKIKKALSIPR